MTDETTFAEPNEPSIEARVSAMEQALACLGDHLSPGHRNTLEPYLNWRKSLDRPTNAPTPSAPPTDADGLRLDGPTLEEYVSAGYKVENYPPSGYAAR